VRLGVLSGQLAANLECLLEGAVGLLHAVLVAVQIAQVVQGGGYVRFRAVLPSDFQTVLVGSLRNRMAI
jgi:hypothetical protein